MKEREREIEGERKSGEAKEKIRGNVARLIFPSGVISREHASLSIIRDEVQHRSYILWDFVSREMK